MDYYSEGVEHQSKDELIELLELLRKYAPHVDWQLCWGDYDSGVDEIITIPFIGFPDHQIDEAEYIMELIEEGEDISKYSPEDRFFHLFKEDDEGYHLLDSISLFYEYGKQLLDLLECTNENIDDYIDEASHLISNLYALYFQLPESDDFPYFDAYITINIPDKLKKICDKIPRKLDDMQSLEGMLEDIAREIQIGILHYDQYLQTRDYHQLSMAVTQWKKSFDWKYGWGTGGVNALKMLHTAKMHLRNEIELNVDLGVEPKDYIFAHCIYDIPGISEFENLLVDTNYIRFYGDLSDFVHNTMELLTESYWEWLNIMLSDIWGLIIETYELDAGDKALLLKLLLDDEERNLVKDKKLEEWEMAELSLNWDDIWAIIDKRIKKEKDIIIEGEFNLEVILKWVNLLNIVMDLLPDTHLHNGKLYFNILIGTADDFPSYFVDNLLHRIDYHLEKGFNYPLTPFRDNIINLRSALNKLDASVNQIVFGRFLEWVNICKDILEK